MSASARERLAVTRIEVLTGDRWVELEELFGEKGACAGCWCMWWRTTSAEYRAGDGNRSALRELADAAASGLLAYCASPETGADQVAGWCSVAPRAEYRRLATAVVGRGGKDEPGRWAVPCFYVRPGLRRRGLTDALLEAACAHARKHGASVIEGYPTSSERAGAPDLYVGTRNLFERHGFVVVREPTANRTVMERVLR